jgi:hypothetical protein
VFRQSPRAAAVVSEGEVVDEVSSTHGSFPSHGDGSSRSGPACGRG